MTTSGLTEQQEDMIFQFALQEELDVEVVGSQEVADDPHSAARLDFVSAVLDERRLLG